MYVCVCINIYTVGKVCLCKEAHFPKLTLPKLYWGEVENPVHTMVILSLQSQVGEKPQAGTIL